MSRDNSSRTGYRGRRWTAGKAFSVVIFAATALLVYEWLTLHAKPAARVESYTATAVVRWQNPPPSGRDDAPAASLLPPTPAEIEQRLVSVENVRRAVCELTECMTHSPESDSTAAVPCTVADAQRHLRVGASIDPLGKMQISISSTQAKPQHATLLVNALAEQCAGDYRAAWRAAGQKTLAAAQDASQSAQRDLLAAKAQLDAFYQENLQPPPREVDRTQPHPPEPRSAALPPAAEPVRAENPEWTELNGRLEELQRRRTVLLSSRTAAHPLVQDIDLSIADLTGLLNAKPRWIGTQPPASASRGPATAMIATPPATQLHIEVRPGQPSRLPPTTGPDDLAAADTARRRADAIQSYEELKAAVDRCEQARELAARRERQAWQVAMFEPQIEVVPAMACVARPADLADPRLLLIALVAGLAVAAGVRLLSVAAGSPRLATIAEAQTLLPAPIVAVLPGAIVQEPAA